MTECKDCRYWAGHNQYLRPKTATCSRIHNGGGQRDDPARIFPPGVIAYLETEYNFSCSEGRAT